MKNLVTILIIIFMLHGCFGADVHDLDGNDNKVPIITSVVFTDDDNKQTATFNIGDSFDILVNATDPDLDMGILFITEYCVNDLMTLCYGPTHSILDQEEVDEGYRRSGNFFDSLPGFYKFEFQIEDFNGNSSNIFEVIIVVQAD